MTIDDQIRKSLEQQAASENEILLPERGLFGMLRNAFSGSMRRWVWLTNFMAIAASVFVIWSGFAFFTADGGDQRVFWGVCLIISLQAQGLLKMWIFQEMNRVSLAREIKRLELLVARQQD